MYPGTIEFPLAVGPAYTESGTAFSGSLGSYRRGRDWTWPAPSPSTSPSS